MSIDTNLFEDFATKRSAPNQSWYHVLFDNDVWLTQEIFEE